MRLRGVRAALPALLVLGLAVRAGAYGLVYDVTFLPSSSLARVEIRVDQQAPGLRKMELNVQGDRWFDFTGDGEITGEDPVVWKVPPDGGTLRYSAQLDHLRDPAEYDARISEKWAIFRGEDLVPPGGSRFAKGAEADALLRFRLPPKWRVLTAYPRLNATRFRVEQPDRSLDRPEGWMIAGRIQYQRTEIAGMETTVASPAGHGVHRRDLLALLTWTAPTLQDILGGLPERILVIGADDPMWRGGLSGPGSIYVHADRPLIDRDGTSPLVHELMHVVSNARSGEGGDWIVEGLAEYYSVEVLVRSGTVLPEHGDEVLERLRERGEKVRREKLVSGESSGAITARAVSILHDLDREIASRSEGRASLDNVLRALQERHATITLDSFVETVRDATGLDLEGYIRERMR